MVWLAVAAPLFLLAFLREWPLPTGWTLIDWHAHELLFAGLEAVLALRVADAARRTRGVLVALFVLGRAAIATSAWLGPLVAALADLAFPALLLGLAGRRPPRDWALLAALAALLPADALFHLEAASGQLGLGFRLALADALAVLCVAVRRAAQPPPSAAPLAAGLVACAALIALGRLGAWLLAILPGSIGPASLHRGLAGLAAIGWAVGRRAVTLGVWTGVPIGVVGGIAFAILVLGRAVPAARAGRAADALAGAALAWWIAAPGGRTAGILLIAAGTGQALCGLPPIARSGLAGRLGLAAAPFGLAALGAASLWPRLVTPSTGLHALGAALAIAAAASLGERRIALLGLLLAAAARIAAPFSPHYTGLLKLAALFWLIGWMWLARRRLGSVLMRN